MKRKLIEAYEDARSEVGTLANITLKAVKHAILTESMNTDKPYARIDAVCEKLTGFKIVQPQNIIFIDQITNSDAFFTAEAKRVLSIIENHRTKQERLASMLSEVKI